MPLTRAHRRRRRRRPPSRSTTPTSATRSRRRWSPRSSPRWTRFEADEAVGAVVVTGTPPAFCAGANLGNLADGRRRQPRQRLRGLPAHRPQPAADARRRQRRRRRRRDEPRPRLRRAHRRPAGQVRHPLPADRPAPRRRAHVDVPAHRRAAGGDGRGAVRRGARRRRGRARRARVPLRRRRRAARRGPRDGGPGGVGARASWSIATKATIQDDGRHRRPPGGRRSASSSRSCGAPGSRGSPSASPRCRRRSRTKPS